MSVVYETTMSVVVAKPLNFQVINVQNSKELSGSSLMKKKACILRKWH